MPPKETDKIYQALQEQENKIQSILARLDALEGKEMHFVAEPIVQQAPIENKQVHENIKPASKLENPTNWFKMFGVAGIIMILLAMVYFYVLAVDNGWIGIGGRIALGVFFSLVMLGAGITMYNKGYVNYSQILNALGLGLMFFTIFATYHFDHYRQALGMTLTLNTILLLFIMIGGAFLGLKLDSRFVLYGAILIGYAAAFLSGIDGDTLHILIYILLVGFLVLYIAKVRAWYIGIPAQVLTYIAYLIWYIQGVNDPSGILRQTSSPVFVTFAFLLSYYAIFTVLSFIQASGKKENECMALSIINTVAFSALGFGIIAEYFPEAKALFLMIAAVITLVVGFLSKRFGFSNILDLQFLGTVILVALAVPVQFDKTIVTVIWVAMAVGITYAGVSMHHTKLFYVGFIGYAVPALRLFMDLALDSFVERFLAIGSGIAGIIILHTLYRKMEKQDALLIPYAIFGHLISLTWMVIEIMELDMARGLQNSLISIAWAIYSIGCIAYGISRHRRIITWSGIIIFGIVILKILIFDLSSLQTIYKVMALLGVGLLALLGSFFFVRNKELIKEYV